MEHLESYRRFKRKMDILRWVCWVIIAVLVIVLSSRADAQVSPPSQSASPILVAPIIGIATGTSLVVTGVLTAGAGSAIGWTGRTQITSAGADGFISMTNAAGTSLTSLLLGPGGGNAATPSLTVVQQTNPQFYFRDGAGAGTANVFIESQKSTTGVRYVCINTAGQLVSQAVACVGT